MHDIRRFDHIALWYFQHLKLLRLLRLIFIQIRHQLCDVKYYTHAHVTFFEIQPFEESKKTKIIHLPNPREPVFSGNNNLSARCWLHLKFPCLRDFMLSNGTALAPRKVSVKGYSSGNLCYAPWWFLALKK